MVTIFNVYSNNYFSELTKLNCVMRCLRRKLVLKLIKLN